MENLEGITAAIEKLVQEKAAMINARKGGLFEAEEEIACFLNGIGGLMVEKVMENVQEPTCENRLTVKGKKNALQRQPQSAFYRSFRQRTRQTAASLSK